MKPSFQKSCLLLLCVIFLLNSSIIAKGKQEPKEKNNVPVEKEIVGKVVMFTDKVGFTKYYRIGNYQAVSSVKDKLVEWEGKTVKAFCRIDERDNKILILKEIEEYTPPKDTKDKKKKK